MSEVPNFEDDLVAKFHADRRVNVPIKSVDGETFVQSTDRIARQVMDIMQRHDLYAAADNKLGEWVISNVQQGEEGKWSYSVRVQEPDEEE
jgi:hypothetical protein